MCLCICYTIKGAIFFAEDTIYTQVYNMMLKFLNADRLSCGNFFPQKNCFFFTTTFFFFLLFECFTIWYVFIYVYVYVSRMHIHSCLVQQTMWIWMLNDDSSKCTHTKVYEDEKKKLSIQNYTHIVCLIFISVLSLYWQCILKGL